MTAAAHPSHRYLQLRDLNDALNNDQPFLWRNAWAAGADLRIRGGDEVLDLLLFQLAHYDPPVTVGGEVPSTGPAQAVFDFNPERPWREQALDDVLARGVRLNPCMLLRLYRAGNTEVLGRLLAQDPIGMDEEQRALLLCLAALVREPAPRVDGVRPPGYFHVVEPRRTQLFQGLVRWGLPSELTLDPVSVANDQFFFHLGRISLHAQDGPAGLTAFHTPAISFDTLRPGPQTATLFVADHWLGPRNVLNPEQQDQESNRQRFATMVERATLEHSLHDLPVPAATPTLRPRL